MAESDKAFTGSIPEIYDTYLVPMIFEQYASDLAQRVEALAPNSVLETAAGSGVVSRAVAPCLTGEAQYVVTDLNQPMLDHAASKQPDSPLITWRQADALNLPFAEESFDIVLCQFGVMFFPNRTSGYREANRVLRPNGSFIFNVWDDISANEFADVATQAVATVFPDDPPQFLARIPYGYHDQDLIREELTQAGFTNIDCTTVEAISTAPSPRHVAIAWCQGTPFRNEIEARDASLLDRATDCAAELISERFGSGAVSARIQAHVFTAGF